MKPYNSYETERLLINPTTEDDAGFIFELLNSPKWKTNIGDRKVESLDEALEYIRTRITPQLLRLGYSNYTVTRKSDQLKIGSCGLYDREGLEGIDIGFAFLPKFEKQGYAFESANRLKNAAIHDFGIIRISAITIKENIPSQKLLEKLGLKFIEVVKLPKSDEDVMLYRYDHV